MSVNNSTQVAKEKVQAHENNESVEQAGCCPKVENFSVSQEGRTYKLDIVVDKKEQAPNDDIYKDYRLFIVTPPAKDGKVTTKKINIKQEFLTQKTQCKFGIEASDEYGNKIFLDIGDSLEIDTNGNLKTKTLQTTKAPKKPEEIVKKVEGDMVTLNSGRIISCTSGYDETQTRYKNPLRYKKFNINDLERKQKKLTDQEMDNLIEYINSLSPLKQKNEHSISYFFKLFTGQHDVLKKITLKPVGSPKCTAVTKHASLYLLENMSLKGDVKVSFSPEHTTANKNFKGRDRNQKIDVVNSYVSASGSLEFKSGTHIISFGLSASKGGDTTKIKRKKVQDLFKGPSKCINQFYDIFDKASKSNPTIIFNPGTTSIGFKADDLTIQEKQKGYGLDWKGKVELGIFLFDKSEIKLDIINAVISKGNAKMSKFVEMVRDKVEKGYDGKYVAIGGSVKVDLLLKGSLSGTCQWEKDIEKEITASGKIVGTIDIELIGKIEASARVFEVKSKAGVEVGGTSGISAELTAKSGKKEMEYDGDVFFNGLVLWYAYYAELERKKSESTIMKNKKAGYNNKKNILRNKKVETKVKEELILLDKFSIIDSIFGKEEKA